ncbi:MAG: hypothetical protein ACP5OC_01035 [Thermoplasmata archaeon]
MERSETEMMDPKYIRDRIVGVVQEYFEERDDTTFVSFGKAGARVLKKVLPFETGKINFHSVVLSDAQPKPVKEKRRWFRRASYFEVDLDEGRSGISKSAGNGLALESVYYKINTIKVGGTQFVSSPHLLAEQILSNMDKSSGFILVTGFGGNFGQTMHVEFAKLLKKRGIPHMSVVIKPQKTQKQQRFQADKAIIELMSHDSNVKVYDNELLLGKEMRLDPMASFMAMDRVNDVICRDLKTYGAILSEIASEMKNPFI